MIGLWTFMEYYIHRFVLHGELNHDEKAQANPKIIENCFERHFKHHVFMNQRYRIVQRLNGYPGYIIPIGSGLRIIFSTS